MTCTCAQNVGHDQKATNDDVPRRDSRDLVYAYNMSDGSQIVLSMQLSATCHFNHCYLLVSQLIFLLNNTVRLKSDVVLY